MTDGPSRESKNQKDEVRPYHAKDASTGQEAAEAVAAVLKHAAERDRAAKQKAPPKQQPKWMLPVGLNLGVLAVYLLIAPPSWVVVNPIAAPPVEERIESTGNAMFLAASKIEGFRAREGRLPATLAEAGVGGADALDYTPRGESYLLVAIVGEETLSFDSSTQSAADLAPNFSTRIGG